MKRGLQLFIGQVFILIFVLSIFVVPVEAGSTAQEEMRAPNPLEQALDGTAAPEEVKGGGSSKWVEHQRGPTYIQYRNTTHPSERMAEFGHRFTWNGTTWAPYSFRQLSATWYQVNTSQTTYEISTQGVQTFDKNGTRIMSEANWRVYRMDAQEKTETQLNFDQVTLTYQKSSDYLLVTRTSRGTPEDGILTEIYTFTEGMKVTANYTAASEGSYHVALKCEELPQGTVSQNRVVAGILITKLGTVQILENDSQDRNFSDVLAAKFGSVQISWEDAEDLFETMTFATGIKGPQVTLDFMEHTLESGQSIVIDPSWVAHVDHDGGDGYLNEERNTWWPSNFYRWYLYVSKNHDEETGRRRTWLSFDLGDALMDVETITTEEVWLWETDERGGFNYDDDGSTIYMTYFTDNIPMGPDGDDLLDEKDEIWDDDNHEAREVNIPGGDVEGGMDLDVDPQWVHWNVPQGELNDWTKSGDQWANYYLFPVAMDSNEWVKFYSSRHPTSLKRPKLLIYFTTLDVEYHGYAYVPVDQMDDDFLNQTNVVSVPLYWGAETDALLDAANNNNLKVFAEVGFEDTLSYPWPSQLPDDYKDQIDELDNYWSNVEVIYAMDEPYRDGQWPETFSTPGVPNFQKYLELLRKYLDDNGHSTIPLYVQYGLPGYWAAEEWFWDEYEVAPEVDLIGVTPYAIDPNGPELCDHSNDTDYCAIDSDKYEMDAAITFAAERVLQWEDTLGWAQLHRRDNDEIRETIIWGQAFGPWESAQMPYVDNYFKYCDLSNDIGGVVGLLWFSYEEDAVDYQETLESIQDIGEIFGIERP